MINILVNWYDFDKEWSYESLKKYIKPEMKVVVFPLSYKDEEVNSWHTWYQHYGDDFNNPQNGYWMVVNPLQSFGIPRENTLWINYFNPYFWEDIERTKEFIRSSDIIYFTGGMPDRMMDRIRDMGLLETIENFNGVVIGVSAGALIQVHEYHITPDEDYPHFGYHRGLNMINNIDVESHYENTPHQNAIIEKCLNEKNKPIYAFAPDGAVVVNNGEVETIGNVKKFEK